MSTADRPALDEAVRRDPTPPVPILELRRVSKRFGEFLAVDDFSLEIASGEFLTLLGASGSGKTTTLRMIAGFEQPTAGEIHMAGRPIAGLPPFKRDVNTVFQHYALFPHMSVRENIGYGLRMRGVPQAEREQRIAAALEMVKLEQLGGARRASSPVDSSSGSPWPARWSTAPRCCCSTSRSAHSISSYVRKCNSSSSTCKPTWGSPSST